MKTITSSIRQCVKVWRVVAIGAAVAIGAFILFLFLSSLGMSDPAFPGLRAYWTISGVISWPLVLAEWINGRAPPFVFWPPLLFLAGLFWALLIEVCIIRMIHARKA